MARAIWEYLSTKVMSRVCHCLQMLLSSASYVVGEPYAVCINNVLSGSLIVTIDERKY